MFGDKNLKKIEAQIAKNGELKLNIHLSLSDNLKQWVANSNKKLNANVYYNIVYGPNSIMQPHISLLICKLKKANLLSKVLEIINEQIKDIETFEIEFDNFSLSENKHWAFLWVKENVVLNKIIGSLKTALAQYLTFDYDSVPHITLARSEELYKNEVVLNSLEIPPKQVIDKIEIAYSGYFGTVLKVIKSYKLK